MSSTDIITGSFFSQRSMKIVLYGGAILIGIQILLLILKWGNLPPQLPLYYSRPWGDEQIAPRLFVSIFPIISIICLLINTMLARVFFYTENLLSTVLLWSAMLVVILSSIGFIKILFLVS